MRFNKIKISLIIILVVLFNSSFKMSTTSGLDKSSIDKSVNDTSKKVVSLKYTIHGKLVSDREIDSIIKLSIKETIQKNKENMIF